MCGKARVGGQHHVHQSRCRGKKDVLEETWGQGSTAVTDRSRGSRDAKGQSKVSGRAREEG